MTSGGSDSNGTTVIGFSYYFLIKLFNFIKKTPPNGVVVSMIFGIENHGNPSHYDLHIENFNLFQIKVFY